MRWQELANVAAFQCAWFACVLSAATHRPGIGLAAVLALLAWHLWRAHAPLRELRLIAIAAGCGIVFESLLAVSGWVRLPQSGTWGVTPLWMVALWAAFATTLNVSLRKLRTHYMTSAALAAVGAPLAYYAGSRLGALEWVALLPGLALVAAGWALAAPLLMRAARNNDGFAVS